MPKNKAAQSSSMDSDSGPEDRTPMKKAKKSDNNETAFELAKNRRVTVRSFKGKTYVDIREFYEKDGELCPGKKGISLTPEQWKKLLENVDDINKSIQEL